MNNIDVSIIIKALNEDDKVAKCIESCLKAAEPYNSEVILVDSLSTDNTVGIAKQYPIKIVQFTNQEDVGCGAAPQLGYQFSSGKFIYIIDGDMEFCDGFIDKAITYLSENSTVAGVAGKLIDTLLLSNSDKRRATTYGTITKNENVTHLGGGGLYRREAIESVGYFTHSGLQAFEEFELGARLTTNGWLLTRLAEDALLHTGHVESAIESLKRLWRNGRLAANGALLKSAMGKPWFKKCVSHLWYVFLPVVINLLIAISLLILNLFTNITVTNFLLVFTGIWLVIASYIATNKRSFKDSLISIFTWHLTLLAILFTVSDKYADPNLNIKGNILK